MERQVTPLKHVATLLSLILIAIPVFSALNDPPLAEAQASGKQQFTYTFDVDEDGNVKVVIRLVDETTQAGSSWVVVPSFVPWRNETGGSLRPSNLGPVITESGVSPFWQNYSFTYLPGDEPFSLTISFNISQYVFIIEPNGFFLSSEVEFPPTAQGSMAVVLPFGVDVSSSNVTLIDYTRGTTGSPSGLRINRQADGTLRVTASVTSHSRLAIAMSLPGKKVDLEALTLGRFTAKTPGRYVARTTTILELFNRSYPIMSALYNVNLSSVNFTFFVPTLDQFLSGLAGFVPFTPGGQPGAINVNMFYFRTTEGYIEIIALHELAHHFIWQLGFPPEKLWVHEGIAQYSSIETAKLLGYEEGAEDQERALTARAQGLKGEYGFIQDWTQSSSPRDVGSHYAASYMIFKTLGDDFGGVGFYERAFKILRSYISLKDDSTIVTALGSAGGNTTAIIRQFQSWGFNNIIDVAQLRGLLDSAKAAINEVNPLFQPYALAAQLMLNMAESSYAAGRFSNAFTYIIDATFYAENALTLALLTYTGAAILAALAYWVHGQMAYRRAGAPYQPPTQTRYRASGILYCYRCGSRLPDAAIFCAQCGTKRLGLQPRNAPSATWA